jgi:hypothetical protein
MELRLRSEEWYRSKRVSRSRNEAFRSPGMWRCVVGCVLRGIPYKCTESHAQYHLITSHDTVDQQYRCENLTWDVPSSLRTSRNAISKFRISRYELNKTRRFSEKEAKGICKVVQLWVPLYRSEIWAQMRNNISIIQEKVSFDTSVDTNRDNGDTLYIMPFKLIFALRHFIKAVY